MSKAHFLNMQTKEQQLAQKDGIINQLIRDNNSLKAALQKKSVIDLFLSHALSGAVAGYSTKPHIESEIPVLANMAVDMALSSAQILLDKLDADQKEIDLKAEDAISEILKDKELEATKKEVKLEN